MANLHRVYSFGNSKVTRSRAAAALFEMFETSNFTGSFLFNKENHKSDYDIFISSAEGWDVLEDNKLSSVLRILEGRISFELYVHTTRSEYNKPWIKKIYRLKFSNKFNDHIDLIVIDEDSYINFKTINDALYLLRDSYNKLSKARRNDVINTAMNIAKFHSIDYTLERLDTIIFLEALRENYS